MFEIGFKPRQAVVQITIVTSYITIKRMGNSISMSFLPWWGVNLIIKQSKDGQFGGNRGDKENPELFLWIIEPS
jgi:hypothetical protein